MKTTKEDFAAYKQWQKYILRTHPKLPDGYKRATLIAYALAMAIKGTNGLECYASDRVIAEELEMYRRDRVGDYRHLALELGWFVRTGKRKGRAEVLNISIPSETVSPETVTEIPNDAEHDAALSVADCPACKPLYDQVRSGELTMERLEGIHHFYARLQPFAPFRGAISVCPP